jgi:hypothetical protein
MVHYGGGARKKGCATSGYFLRNGTRFQRARLEMAVTPPIRGKLLVTGAHGFIGRAHAGIWR